MNNLVAYNGVRLELLLNEPPTETRNGWAHPARLVGSEANLGKLIGMPLWDQKVRDIVKLSDPSLIGLVVGDRKWTGMAAKIDSKQHLKNIEAAVKEVESWPADKLENAQLQFSEPTPKKKPRKKNVKK